MGQIWSVRRKGTVLDWGLSLLPQNMIISSSDVCLMMMSSSWLFFHVLIESANIWKSFILTTNESSIDPSLSMSFLFVGLYLTPSRPRQPIQNIASSINPNVIFLNQNAASRTTSNRLTSSEGDSSGGSCKECLYTGVVTCTGLSLYFLKLASEVPDADLTAKLVKQNLQQKRFLLGGSMVSAICGVYRIYLGW